MILRTSAGRILLGLTLLSAAVLRAEESPEGLALFREQVEPLLRTQCYACHSGAAEKVQGGLRLDGRELARRGGDLGPAVVPGKPGESLLVQALRHEGGLAMPPEKPALPAATIASVVKWIELGAPDPRDGPAAITENWSPAERGHWAFQPVRRPVIPAPGGLALAQPPFGPIDLFLQQALAERGWSPAPPASRELLIRRVSFDLTGLPPTPADASDFIRDRSPDAYERLVDRLFASPHCGERQAQHWLDVVRYAESEGYEYDRHLPEAWRYRDYVVQAFNRDLPYDQFVREQVAGDELGREPNQLAAAVLHRLGPVRRNAGNPEIALSRNEVLTERTDCLGAAFLGLTVGCARCHNHKREPISQRDYYRLQAYLAATAEENVSLATPAEQAAWEAETARIKAEMDRLKLVLRTKTGAERTELQAQVDALEETLPPQPACIPTIRNDFSHRTPIHVLRRGEWEKKLEPVSPRPLSILVSAETPELPADAAAPRTALADWLIAPENPLPARVFVNRLWQAAFGQGLVATPNDFGLHGARPSHPALLDWLAAEFVERGWRPKVQLRQLVLSAAYRQASRHPAAREAAALDPENRLLWKHTRRRLSAEELRDAMLVAAGLLHEEIGGPSVMTPVDPELIAQLYKPSQWQVSPRAADHHRRALYLIAKRNLRLPFFEAFDGPALLSSCGRRESSTHALQSLELWNGALANELAAALALRLTREADAQQTATPDDAVAQRERLIARAFALTVGRSPTAAEQSLARDFLGESYRTHGALTEFALALLNLNDFAYAP